MATKKKAAAKAATKAPAATKKATKAAVPATKNTTKPPRPVVPSEKDDIKILQAKVKDSVGQPISLEEIASAKSKISNGSKEDLYTLLREWGYKVAP